MRVLVQRSGKSSVDVYNKTTGKIDNGLVLLVGFTEGDDIEKIKYLAKKVVNLRIFDDEEGVMNKSILDVGGKILSISQFTLYADTSKGDKAIHLYDLFNEELKKYIDVEKGIFGAEMTVSITNLGPVTILLER